MSTARSARWCMQQDLEVVIDCLSATVLGRSSFSAAHVVITQQTDLQLASS